MPRLVYLWKKTPLPNQSLTQNFNHSRPTRPPSEDSGAVSDSELTLFCYPQLPLAWIWCFLNWDTPTAKDTWYIVGKYNCLITISSSWFHKDYCLGWDYSWCVGGIPPYTTGFLSVGSRKAYESSTHPTLSLKANLHTAAFTETLWILRICMTVEEKIFINF